MLADWAAQIQAAAAAGASLRIRGGGSKDFYGGEPAGTVFDVRGYAGVVDYVPTELVLTVRAGTPLAEVTALLAANRQMLACELPDFGGVATIGGAVAAGLSGPRRPYAGAVRDFVLGVRLLDGTGSDLQFGGRVMKNVAGFDVSRLCAGSLGTLGVLTELSLKCTPLPAAGCTLVLPAKPDEAVRRLNQWAGQPLPLSGGVWLPDEGGRLLVRLEGAAAAVASATGRIGGDLLAEAEAADFWRAWGTLQHPAFNAAGTAELWRLSVRSTAPWQDFGVRQLIDWGGAQRWLIADRPLDIAALRDWCGEHGGHATLFRGPAERKRTAGVFQPRPAALAKVEDRLRRVFDPKGVFDQGRNS